MRALKRFRFTEGLGRGNSPLSVRELRPHFPDSPGGPDGSGPPGSLKAVGSARARDARWPPVRPSCRSDRRLPSCEPRAPSRVDRHARSANFLDSAGKFFSQLANLSWVSLLIGLALYAAVPAAALAGAVQRGAGGVPRRVEVRWRDVWGAYMVGYAVNNVFPLGGGNLAQLFLTRISIPPSSYPTVASGAVDRHDLRLVHGLAGDVLRVHPGRVPQAAGLLEAAGIRHQLLRRAHALHAVLPDRAGDRLRGRVRAAVGDGAGVLAARPAGLRRSSATAAATCGRCASWQFASWVAPVRGAYWALLDAFHIGGSVRNALLVLAVQVVASVFPFTPGRAGVQQALLLTIFADNAVRGLVLGRPADRHRGAQRACSGSPRWS